MAGYILLPEHIVMEIILRLPSKSVIRFKSVRKSWCSLISGPQFLSKHLLPADDLLLVKRRHKDTNHQVFSLLSSDHTHISQTRLLPYPQLPPPSDADIEMLGPLNGLVCLYNNLYYQGHQYIVLWRPVDGEMKVVPDSDVLNKPRTNARDPILGFGYDILTHDYKVIKISTLSHSNGFELTENKVEIYSFNANTWKGTPTVKLPRLIFRDRPQHLYMAYVNGFCMWYGQDSILWFRMSEESFGTTLFPPQPENDSIAVRYEYDDDDIIIGPWWHYYLYVMSNKTIALVMCDMLARPTHAKYFHVYMGLT